LQKKMAIYIALIAAMFTIFMVLDYNTMKMQFPGSTTYPGIWSVLPIIIIVLAFMAWRGVRKDEALIKSMDRIR
jgi:heme/copper-type cytochrome/quinol oxidase subunit 2